MVFRFQWTKSFWTRSEELLDVGAGVGNLSSESTALVDLGGSGSAAHPSKKMRVGRSKLTAEKAFACTIQLTFDSL